MIEKSPGFPIWADLTHYVPKSGHRGLESCKWNKQQGDLDDVLEITAFWTHSKEKQVKQLFGY